MNDIRLRDVKTYVQNLISETLGARKHNTKDNEQQKGSGKYEMPSPTSVQRKVAQKNKIKADGL